MLPHYSATLKTFALNGLSLGTKQVNPKTKMEHSPFTVLQKTKYAIFPADF